MGKSHALRCEVQLLDDQSTTVDLDVSHFFGLETIGFCVECFVKCSCGLYEPAYVWIFLEKKNEKKNKRANECNEFKSGCLKRSWKINVAKNFWEKAKRKVINAIRDFI